MSVCNAGSVSVINVDTYTQAYIFPSSFHEDDLETTIVKGNVMVAHQKETGRSYCEIQHTVWTQDTKEPHQN